MFSAALSTLFIVFLSPPPFPAKVKEVHLFGDNDDAGRAAVEKAIGAYEARGLVVKRKPPPPEFKDWNAFLLSTKWSAV